MNFALFGRGVFLFLHTVSVGLYEANTNIAAHSNLEWGGTREDVPGIATVFTEEIQPELAYVLNDVVLYKMAYDIRRHFPDVIRGHEYTGPPSQFCQQFQRPSSDSLLVRADRF